MERRLQLTVLAAIGVAGALYLSLRWGLGGLDGGDYYGGVCNGCDSAGPPVAALAHGNLSKFLRLTAGHGQPHAAVARPLVALVPDRGADLLLPYRRVLAGLLTAVALLLPVVRRMRSFLAAAVVMAIALFGPMTFKAVAWGHPEELVGGCLAVGAVVTATRGRGVLSGVLLGLAIANKQWGLFALIPTLIVARGHWRVVLTTAVAVAAVFIAPMLLGDPKVFIQQNFDTGVAQLGVTPTNVWWPFHEMGYDATIPGNLWVIPAWMRELSHPLAVTIVVAISLLYWRRAGDRHPYDALQLLALLFLLRCLLDPLTISYHHVPFVVALVAYEGLRRNGLPWLSLASTAALIFIVQVIVPTGNSDLLCVAYLTWALPMAACLGAGCFAPRPRAAADTLHTTPIFA